MQTLIIYLIIINALAFLLMLADKQKARKKQWRIPEAILIGSAIFGGSIGCLAGMYTARHKTRKPAFFIGIPFIIFLQAAVAYLCFA